MLLDTLRSDQEHHGIELDYLLPSRTLRIQASSGRLLDGRGHQLGAVAVIRDITETSSLRQQVARADQLAVVGEMASGIAHELRTPLTSIRGFIQYLQGSTDPKEWQEYGDIIVREVDSLNRIVSELLDLVRQQPPHPVPSDLNRLVKEALLLARDCAKGKRIEFVLELDDTLPWAVVNQSQIKQVLLNVIVNAVQAIAGQGVIRIGTREWSGDRVCLRVNDNGCGIPAAYLDRIFDPFFSTKPTGTGLGMAIAQRILMDHDGRIEVESTEEQGTTVLLILPRQPQATQP
jgi:two-component system sensor histidine kinase AtoS